MRASDFDDAWNSFPEFNEINEETGMKREILRSSYTLDMITNRCLALEKQNQGLQELVKANTEGSKLDKATIEQLRTELAEKAGEAYQTEDQKRMEAYAFLKKLGYVVYWPKNKRDKK